MDPYGVSIVTICIVLGLHATRTSYGSYKELGTEFFMYATLACASLTIMIAAYFFPSLFSSAEYQDLVNTGQSILASFGLLALALLIHASEYAKEPNDSVINGAFLISGALIASRFLPGEYQILWAGTRWVQHYGPIVIALSVLQFVFLLAVMGPLVYRVWVRIRKSEAYRAQSRILFLGFASILLLYGLYMIIINSTEFALSPISAAYYMFLVLLAGLTGTIARLLRLYPTIFFTSSHDIREIQFVSKATQNTVYRFQLHPDDSNADSLSISIAHDSIRHVFHEALDEPGEVRSIKVQDNEVLACEGDQLYGLLVTKKGSELLRRILVKSLALFEQSHNTMMYQESEDFDAIMRNYFQFAIHNHATKAGEKKS